MLYQYRIHSNSQAIYDVSLFSGFHNDITTTTDSTWFSQNAQRVSIAAGRSPPSTAQGFSEWGVREHVSQSIYELIIQIL